jgi:hypothetical protein
VLLVVTDGTAVCVVGGVGFVVPGFCSKEDIYIKTHIKVFK